MNSTVKGCIHIRSPRPDDIRGIVGLVRNCEPFLSAHRSYIYWISVQYFRETCAVAELDGEIVGWCSMVPVSDRKYFLHQLGVAPRVRRRGVAASLFVHLLRTLKRRHSAFEIEFTSDRRNSAVLQLNKSIAERMGMRLIKKPDVVRVIEDSQEELYAMAATLPEENDRAFRPAPSRENEALTLVG